MRPATLRTTREHVSEGAMAFPSRTPSKGPGRDPPPALFLHPSPTASHVSLPGILAPGASVPGSSPLARERSNVDNNGTIGRLGPDWPADIGQQRPRGTLKSAASSRSVDRTDALWAEMQATLEEVELSASGGTHVFGPEHDKKLGDLRAAQIALAQAWARSEADDTIETAYGGEPTASVGDEVRNLRSAFVDASKSGEGTDPAKSTAPSISGRPESSAGVERLGAKLEEETEADLRLARQRREANDQYFQRVNNGVIDVVAKLEEVAMAMRAVEQESKDVWNETESFLGSVKT